MTTYYLEVLKSGLTLCVNRPLGEDDPSGRDFLRFNCGDLLKCDYGQSEIVLYHDKRYENPTFYICEPYESILTVSISSAIRLGYLADITVLYEREAKLSLILD